MRRRVAVSSLRALQAAVRHRDGLLNPTSAPVTVALTTIYLDLSGQTVTTVLVLPADSGDILQG